MNVQESIRTAQSCLTDPRQAVREFHAGVCQPNMVLVLFFCSSRYDLGAVASELNALFPGVAVVGCTSAGEIGPLGYQEHGISGVSFAEGSCSAAAGFLEHLQQFETAQGKAFTQSLLKRFEACAPAANAHNSFAFLLVDGLSIREDFVVHTLHDALGKMPLFGGSAGDDLAFGRTWVFHDGAFRTDSAVLLLVSTPLPFRVFKTQHFVCNSERMVVTSADPSRRIVREINGLPAADEYARVVGVPTGDLSPMRFATSPVVVVIDGTDYVRSIQKVNADGSLTFYCAIDKGLTLRTARGDDLPGNLVRSLAAIQADIGEPQVVLGCDCILRKLEFCHAGQKPMLDALSRRHRLVGFSTYGELYGSLHINQTFTGIAIGRPAEMQNDRAA